MIVMLWPLPACEGRGFPL